jgi:hypothetical protein
VTEKPATSPWVARTSERTLPHKVYASLSTDARTQPRESIADILRRTLPPKEA